MFNPKALPPLLRLPLEILDEILEEVDLHTDLLSLALCSHACANLVIPRHSEYRIIRVRHRSQAMWAHLARRSDLARNVREVHLCERDNYLAPDHVPTTLVSAAQEGPLDEALRIRNMCSALSHMTHLRSFTWSSSSAIPTESHAHEAAIMRVLSTKTTLKHLSLKGSFASRAPGIQLDHNSVGYPLWSQCNLKSLVLDGAVWVRPQFAQHLKVMFKLSPTLEYLEMPLDLATMADCRFPQLKTLKLKLQSGTTPHVDKAWVNFLEHHPTIEELSWHPIRPIELSPECLPALKRLQTNDHLLRALDSATTPRKLEFLDLLFVGGAEVLDELKYIDGPSLQKLRLNDPYSFGIWPSRQRIAELFPNLTYLAVFSSDEVLVDDWIDFLGGFPELEVFRGDALWHAVEVDLDRMHLAIMELVQRCLKLKQLDHRTLDKKRDDWKRIVIIREGEEGENVRYEIRRPPPLVPFQFMKSIFA